MTPGRGFDAADDAAVLLSDVAASVGRLVRGELALARAEATEGFRSVMAGLVKAVVAATVGLVGLNVLAGAAVAALVARGFSAGTAGLIVALILFGVAVAFALSARAALRMTGLWPRRTLDNVERDARAVRAGLSEGGRQHV